MLICTRHIDLIYFACTGQKYSTIILYIYPIHHLSLSPAICLDELMYWISMKMVMSCTVYTSFVLLAPDMQRHIYILYIIVYVWCKNVATSSSMYYYNYVYYVHVRCMHVNVYFGLNALTCSKYENILWWHTI